MPSKSSSDFSLHNKLRGFHLKRLNKQKNQASTSSKLLNASTPLLLQPASSRAFEEARETAIDLYHDKGPSSSLKGPIEVELGSLTHIHGLKLHDGRSLNISSRSNQSKWESVDISQSTSKNCFKHFCTTAVKHLPHIYSRKENSLLARKRHFISGIEREGSSVKTTAFRKFDRHTGNKVVSLPNNLTVEAIQYKCKILKLHDTKCGCSSPRLHIYLTTNHRCGDKCSAESYHCVDSISPSSSIDISRKKYIFAIMTGKSKAKGHLRKLANVQRVRKTPKKRAGKSPTNSLSALDIRVRSKANKKNLTSHRTHNDEPESELLGEECESLPTIMNTLSGDVEYIVLDDNTFNLSANTKNTVSHGAALNSKTANMFEDDDVKPNIQSLENSAGVSREGRNWEDILERCLSEASYQSSKNKIVNQSTDITGTKIKCEQVEEGNSSKSGETSSLAEVCTNHCPSIRDIFGDISIKDEPVDTVEDNDMSVEDFSQEIKKLTNSDQKAEGSNKWSISKVSSINQEISTNKGLFAGLIKEETKPCEDDSKDGNTQASDVSVKEENTNNDDDQDSRDEDDDYSSDSSLAPLQIDEGDQAPIDEINSIPAASAPTRGIILPSVNIISPFKIKIFFGTPHRVQLEKPHELFNTSMNASVIGTSSAIPNGVVPNKSIKTKQKAEDEDSEPDSLQVLVGNEATATPSLTCIYCQIVSPDIKALAKHFEDHQKDGLIICYFCQKSFGDKTSMKRHMRTHTGEKPYQCKVCGKRFSLPGNFKKHRDIHEDIRTEPCEVCGKTFRRKEHLKYHMRTHTGEKPYTCTECGTSFTARYSLQIHMNIHLGKKPYKCSYCNKAFSDKSTMRKHVRVHTGEKPFHCDMCGRCFGESGTLAAHMATHRSDRPYKCKQCSLCFKTTGGLRQHEKIHTGEKQYACKFCGVKFLQKYNMTMHERIHTGEKPYACNHCTRSFRSRSCLAKHVVLHGGEEERRYECEHCNSRFYRKAHLRRHIDMHLGIKNYECDICSKKFCTRVSLENHLKTFHAQGARRFPCNWCGRVFKRKVYVNTHECIRDPVKVEKYKQEMKAAAVASRENNTSSRASAEGDDNSSDTDYSSIDIKSEPEEEEIFEEEPDGLGEIDSVIGNASFDIQEDTIKPDPS